ncbi:MAG: hypothetical protein AAFN30_18540, partial [Actinomycetota bacterium]
MSNDVNEQAVHLDGAPMDWGTLVADLNRLLRLRTTPIGMKLFTTAAEMEAIHQIVVGDPNRPVEPGCHPHDLVGG